MDTAKQQIITPHLTNRDAFEKVLADYRLSDSARQILRDVKLVLLNGASATGRNTVINQMVKMGKYRFIVSDTTRPPRVNDGVPEQNGREYWFRKEEDILTDLRQGEFLEAEIIHSQQVSGMSIRELQETLAEHKIALNEVEIGGLQNVVRLKPDTVAIILLPPSYEEWHKRLFGRGEMGPKEYKNRMETAARIFKEAVEGDYAALVVNETVSQAAEDIDRIVEEGTVDPAEQQRGRELAAQLLEKTKSVLATL